MRRNLQVLLLMVAVAFAPAALAAQCLPAEQVPTEVRLARFIALGETHGTAESPRFAGALVCALARMGAPVVLALEVPTTEQPAIDTFVSGGSEAGFIDSLRISPFWSRKVQDGRSSEAMLALLRQVRSLRAQGSSVFVAAIDGAAGKRKSNATQDELMAANLTWALESHHQAHVVALLGSVHARRTAGSPYDSTFRPAVHLLSAKPLLSLLMVHDGGEAWVCQGATMQELACGATRRDGNRSATSAPTVLLDREAWPGYDGHFYVGPITASPPAVGAGRE